MASPELTASISAGGLVFTNWETVEVYRRVGDLTSHIRVRVAELGSGAGGLDTVASQDGWSALKLAPNNPMSASLAGILVLTGIVTIRQVALTPTSHAVDIVCNGKTYDLVTASPAPAQFKNSTAQQIINAVVSPYGLQFVMKGGGGSQIPIERFSIHAGETAKQTVERVGALRNIHFSDNELGNLVGFAGSGGPPGDVGQALVEGQNILEIHGILSIADAADQIIMSAQRFGDDQTNGDAARGIAAKVDYTGVPDVKKVIRATGETDSQEGLLIQANHEAQLNVGTVEEVFITVPGWLLDDGSLWIQHLQQTCSITSPSMFPDTTEVLSLRGVTHRQSNDEGTTTVLEFCLANALFTGGQVQSTWAPDPEPATPAPPD